MTLAFFLRKQGDILPRGHQGGGHERRCLFPLRHPEVGLPRQGADVLGALS